MTTIFTLFRGGNGVGVGAESAGIIDIGGIEFDSDIASVANINFPDSPTIIADVREIDPMTLPKIPSILHASPSCRTASSANQSTEINENGLKESQEDKEGGLAICRFLECWIPPMFTLENVWGYRNYDTFGFICATLHRLGYSFNYWHLNAADYGVPQSRKRLILIARLGKEQWIQKPTPTHHDPRICNHPDQLSMFQSSTRPWNSWYQAIEDLIPTLPESEFAPWQMARLGDINPDTGTFLQMTGATSCNTETRGTGLLNVTDPANTVALNSTQTCAFIVDGQNSGRASGLSVRDANKPALTVTSGGKGVTRAFVVGGQFGKPADGSGEPRPPQIKDQDEPIFCVTAANKGDWRAEIPDSHFERVEAEYKDWRRGDPPPEKPAWLSQGRVVKMTPRCLARFQSFPDSYRLPDHNGLACRVIGNAVPPLLYEKIIGIMSSNPTPAGWTRLETKGCTTQKQ